VGESLLSVGIDVGTSTTQLIVSRLTVENRANAYAVPDLDITGREILYESPIHFTPLKDAVTLDAPAIREIVAEEYQNAGIQPERVKTGAIIITGETARKSNARLVLENLKAFAGAFVVATAGPDLEGVLAAKGSGAVRWSAQTGKTVLHMDIGGGTSNLALCWDGQVIATGCLNVGGRLLKFTGTGEITYVSPVLKPMIPYRVGDILTRQQGMEVANVLASALEMAAGLREKDNLYQNLLTPEAKELETTEAVERSAELAGMVDFFSIGTNDLIQYTLAVDRQNDSLGDFYAPHHEAVLRLIRTASANAHAAGIWCGICGDLGADLTHGE